MKIVIFAPHPDDEIYGCGGSILKWLEDGHNVHIIYVTDNRALITWGIKENQLIEEKAAPYIDLSEDQIGEIMKLKKLQEILDFLLITSTCLNFTIKMLLIR